MKHRIRSRFFLYVLAASLIFALAACVAPVAQAPVAGEAESSGTAAAPVTLNFMHFQQPDDAEAKFFLPALEDFQRDFPNVTLSQEVMSHDEYLTKFKTLAAADQLPDVFEINGDQITGLSNGGLLMDLAPDFAADPAWRDTQAPGMLWEWTRGDSVYAVPRAKMVTHIIYYNSAILKELGFDTFPDTWEGFKDLIVKAKAAGYVPINVGNKGKWPTFDCIFGTLAIRSAGMDWYTKLLAHEESFTNPDFVRALDLFQELVELGAFNDDANSLDMDQSMSYYYNGKSAMFIQGTWASDWVDSNAPAEIRDATKLAVLPPVPGGKGNANEATAGSGWGWGINAKLEGDKRAAAIGLAKALSSEATGRRALEAGQPPAQIVAEYDASQIQPTARAVLEYIPTLGAVPIINMPLPPSVIDIYATGLSDLIAGQGDPATIAAETQAEYEKYQ
jgi:raffinose/stachyose/melibiose transport system substrate-binding protein